MKVKSSFILQELESDDELPDSYNDVPILPAYLDDNRFDKITFPWVNNVNRSLKDKVSKYQYHDKILRHEGILTGQDLYCLKAMESFTCSSTFIWFLNFLLLKDLQSHYKYLKSCLVPDLIPTISFIKKNCNQCEENVNKFEIVIKN